MIRAAVRHIVLGVVLCLGIVLFAAVSEASRTDATGRGEMAAIAARSALSAAHLPSFPVAAKHGVNQLVGLGGVTPASQQPNGLWGGHTMPNWWQSALALWTLVRYLERTGSTGPIYQQAILRLYDHNVLRPHTRAPIDFGNEFNDDTAWWGVAWLEAARYELYVRHDLVNARKFLDVAEWDASFITRQPRVCGGLQWGLGKPPDTITMAEYMHLTAGLYGLRNSPGIFHDATKAGTWLVDAQWSWSYLLRTHLVNTRTGKVQDSLFYASCKPYGAPLTYSQGEVAEALTQMGAALHQPAYYRQAAVFLRYALEPKTGLIRHGILREHCEDGQYNCSRLQSRLDLPAYKGILANALSDWDLANRSNTFRPFLLTQAQAVVKNAILGGAATGCRTASTCLFGFYWSPPPKLVSGAVGASLGGQESGIDALTSVLPRARAASILRP